MYAFACCLESLYLSCCCRLDLYSTCTSPYSTCGGRLETFLSEWPRQLKTFLAMTYDWPCSKSSTHCIVGKMEVMDEMGIFLIICICTALSLMLRCTKTFCIVVHKYLLNVLHYCTLSMVTVVIWGIYSCL